MSTFLNQDIGFPKLNLKQVSSIQLDRLQYSYRSKKPETINELIKRKISSYINFKPVSKSPKKGNNKIKSSVMGIFATRYFPQITSFNVLVNQQKQILFIYKQKMQLNCQQCFLFFFQIIQASIKHEFKISKNKTFKEQSILIQCFLFVAQSLLEIGHQKLAFYFCSKTIQICEIYKNHMILGYSLFLIGKICRKLTRFDNSIIFLKKGLQYMWMQKKNFNKDYQLQVYNQLSYNFLQVSQFQKSKIFGFKYQIGYVQGQDSKIKDLSYQLVSSAINQKTVWQTPLNEQNMQLLLSIDVQKSLKVHRYQFTGRIDQNKIMNVLKINFQIEFQNLVKNDLFSYQVPLPLQIKQNPTVINKRVRNSSQKFITRRRSTSLSNLKVQKQKQKAKQQVLFNYRGISFSKQKLSNHFTQLVGKIKEKLNIQKQ